MNEGLGCNRNLEASQNRASRLRRPCRIGSKPLYQRQLMVLIRSRIESGPLPDPLFFFPERDLLIARTRLAQINAPDWLGWHHRTRDEARFQPNARQIATRRTAKLDPF